MRSNFRVIVSVLGILLCLLYGGLAWELISVTSIPSKNSIFNLFKLTFLFFIIGISFVLLLKKPDICVLPPSIAFVIFAIYHVLNIGRPCGCFGWNSTSGWQMVTTNLVLGISGICFCIWVQQRRCLWLNRIWLPLIIVCSLCLLFFGYARSVPISDSFIDFQGSVGQMHPFVFSKEETQTAFEIETWHVFLINRNCQTCLNQVQKRVPNSIITEMEIVQASSFLVAQNENSNSWYIYVVESGNRGLIPGSFVISHGIVQKFETFE
jgi:hypothetical protein